MHEFWSADGQRLCFHGGWLGDDDRAFAGWCDPTGQQYARHAHHTPGRAYGHYNLHPTELTMVTDGEAAPGCISKVHCRDGQQVFEVLCRHDTIEPEEDQRTHPHPSFTPDGRHVVFTSARENGSNVYLVDWDCPRPTTLLSGMIRSMPTPDYLPPLDHASPYTGWTRAHWVAAARPPDLRLRAPPTAQRLARPRAVPRRPRRPPRRRRRPRIVRAPGAHWGAWLRNPANPTTLTFEGTHSHDVGALFSRRACSTAPTRAPVLLGRHPPHGSAHRRERRPRRRDLDEPATASSTR